MTTSYVILGPNLPADMTARHGETFHVHREGCADIARYGRSATERGFLWVVTADSFAELARDVYADQIDEGSMTVDDAMSDIWTAPCVTAI